MQDFVHQPYWSYSWVVLLLLNLKKLLIYTRHNSPFCFLGGLVSLSIFGMRYHLHDSPHRTEQNYWSLAILVFYTTRLPKKPPDKGCMF